MKQNHSSAGTSINATKLPAIYSKLSAKHDCVILDYGCGRYLDLIKAWCEPRHITYLPYDRFNQPEEVNQESLRMAALAARNDSLMIICSNVLNVIDSDEVVAEIANQLLSFHAPVYITVYEGDRSCKGRESKDDCWQRNERLHDYLRFFPEAARTQKGMIVCPAWA